MKFFPFLFRDGLPPPAFDFDESVRLDDVEIAEVHASLQLEGYLPTIIDVFGVEVIDNGALVTTRADHFLAGLPVGRDGTPSHGSLRVGYELLALRRVT